MNNFQSYVQVINVETGKVFSLPTLYADRTEACVCGQNYIRDRQAENKEALLFFRVLKSYSGKVAESFNIYDEEEEEEELHPICDCDEDDCVGSCECCGLCREEENEAEFDDEEDSPFYLTDEQAEKLAGFLLGLN